MNKVFLLTLIMSAPSFADTLILSKFVNSGYTQPEHSFRKDCKIYKEGHAKIYLRLGQNPETSTQVHVRADKIILIQGLNLAAQRGRLAEEGTRCDAGSMILDGFVRGKKVVLDENKDCESHYVNKSQATKYLQQYATSICGF